MPLGFLSSSMHSVLNWGVSLQYGMPYLKARVQDFGLPTFVNRLVPGFCWFPTSPVHPHSWPPAIRKLDSSVLEGELHFRNGFSRHHELGALEMSHGRLAEARSLGKFYLRPAQ